MLEHIILARITQHINQTNALPCEMVGFRPKLSTQDILLQLSNEVIQPTSKVDTTALLALDLKKAFDTVTHVAILTGLASINPGHRTYNYVKAFLTARTATIRIGHNEDGPFNLANRGTPQGAVISPLLFNLALLRLAHELKQIPNLRFSLYADDITLWVTGGSDAHIESTLQAGTDVVSTQANKAGLICSPTKSELLILPPKRTASATCKFEILVQGHPVPQVPKLKVLGLIIQQNRTNSELIRQLSSQVDQLIALI